MKPSVFTYHNGILCAEAMPLAEIAEDIDTPFYCTSTAQLKSNLAAFAAPFAQMRAQIHYAVRANATLSVIRSLAQAGAGAQVSSAGELERALEAGVDPSKILLTGIGKTRDDLAAALLAGIARIQVESFSELDLLQDVAQILGRRAPVTLRVNPEVWPHGTQSTAQALGEGKFGLSMDRLADAIARLYAAPDLFAFEGLGLQLAANQKESVLFRQAFQKLAKIVELCRAQGFAVSHLDLGSGLGMGGSATGRDLFPAYAQLVKQTFGSLGCSLSFAPGRRLVGDAGVLVTRISHVKESAGRRFYVVDVGMNDIVRPTLFGADHEIIPVREEKQAGRLSRVAIVGPVSEATDQFGDYYLLPAAKPGDLLAIMHAGAYGSAMASTYNGRALIPEVLVSGAQYALVRRRVAVCEQMEWESIPEWMEGHRAA